MFLFGDLVFEVLLKKEFLVIILILCGGWLVEYDWNSFGYEIICIVSLIGGLLEMQVELVGIMLEWFINKYGVELVESSVK